MKVVIFNDISKAIALRDMLANALGYPKFGLDVGNGIHCSPEISKTLYHTDFIQHPKGGRWAIFVDNVCRSFNLGAQEVELPTDFKAEKPGVIIAAPIIDSPVVDNLIIDKV